MANISLLIGFIILLLVQAVIADGHVNIQVQILQYDNPLGTSYYGVDTHSQRKCCDRGNMTACSKTDSCDSLFVFCIGGIRSTTCSGPSLKTSALNNKNSYGQAFDNTIIFSFSWDKWQSNPVEYVADVMDKDGNKNELIDNFTSTIALRADINYESSTTQVLSFRNFVSLDIGLRIWCQDGYSGHDCSRKCTDQHYSVCNKDNGHVLLQSCSSNDVSTLKLQSGSTVPENFTPYHLRQLLSQFFLQEICSDAHQINVEILRFNIESTLEFKVECDNKTLSSMLFNTHIYLLSLTNKLKLKKYFPEITLVVPTVHQQLTSMAQKFVMLRPIHYHDATTSCEHNSCIIEIQICSKKSLSSNCQNTVSMNATLQRPSTNLTICDGYLVDSLQTKIGYILFGVTSWPVFKVNVGYNKHNIHWQNQQQPPATYKAGAPYNKAKPFQMTFSSGSKTFVLEAMIWCDTSHSGDHCQHICKASGNQVCDENGKLICKSGYQGTHCTDINECQGSNPCKNRGTCHNTQGSFTCQCRAHWTGRLCDVDVDECSVGLCLNVTSCTNYPGSFHCRCTHGFKGPHCTDIDECNSPMQICQNKGTCINRYGSYACICADGYTGNRCTQDIDECQQKVCGPHSLNCTNTIGSYTCNCKNGWEGKSCQNDINECMSNPCHKGICQNIPGNFTCSCNNGYTGTLCENDIDFCHDKPCHNGTCRNMAGNYSCSCYSGYTGRNCESDLDECIFVHCGNNGTCINLPYPQRYRCDCLLGWDPKSRCHHHLDECKLLNHCDHGNCSSKNGKYICKCNTGWTGRNCSIFDRCKETPCLHNATCLNEPNNYSCKCTNGWTGRNCSVDINECNVITPCKNNGKCRNTIGGYLCVCDTGWSGKNCTLDVDECSKHNPCKHNSSCYNTQGGYSCFCEKGWSEECAERNNNESFSMGKAQNVPNKMMLTTESLITLLTENGVDVDNKSVIRQNDTLSKVTLSLNLHNNSLTKDNYISMKITSPPNNMVTSKTFSEINSTSENQYNTATYSSNFNNISVVTSFQTIIEDKTSLPISSQAGHKMFTLVNTSSKPLNEQTPYTSSPAKDINLSSSTATSQQNYSTSPLLSAFTQQKSASYENNGKFTSKGNETSQTRNYNITFPPIDLNKDELSKSLSRRITNATQAPVTADRKINETLKTSMLASVLKTTSQTFVWTNYYETYESTPLKPETAVITKQYDSTTQVSDKTEQFLRLEDVIKAKCSRSGWNITLDIPTLLQLFPGINTNQIFFGENTCRGKVRGNVLKFLQGFRECSTVERISGDVILYENKLFYAVYDPIHPYIIRQHKWTFSVECDISRNEATSSHVHHNVETHHSVLTSHYDINMTFFTDPGFTNQLPGNPIQINVGDDVYVKVFTTASDWNIKLRLHTCFTKPNKETDNMTYYIIKNGCEVDSNTHIMSQSTHETRFVYQDFEYSTNMEGLNIYCNATFCESKDYSAGCAQSCIPDK